MAVVGIDINADVGEGIGNEEFLIPLISSCNIACGGHAGDEETMRSTVNLAHKSRVKIGAHPSFPDKKNFGRIHLDMTETALLNSLKSQLQLLISILEEQKLNLHHVKPHGALYNLAATEEKTGLAIIKLMKSLDSSVKLYVPYGSKLAQLAVDAEIDIVLEAFADRNYNKDLTLVSRKYQNAVITDPLDVLDHSLSIVKENLVYCSGGSLKSIKASTLCVHGDNENSLEILRYLHSEFPKYGVHIS